MCHQTKFRTSTSIILFAVLLLLTILPVFAAVTVANEKISPELMEQLCTIPGDTVIKIGVFFVNPPTHEADAAERLAVLREDVLVGKLTPSQFFGDEEFDDVDLDIALRKKANADVYAKINAEYIDKLQGLIEHVEYVSMYAPYADLAVKASNIPVIAEFDFVSSVSYEVKSYAESEDGSDTPFFVEDSARFADTTAEGYPPDLSVDGFRNGGWINGDIDRDWRVTAYDARLALRASVSLWTPFIYEQFYAADINNDYKITAEDARCILRSVVGLDTLS